MYIDSSLRIQYSSFSSVSLLTCYSGNTLATYHYINCPDFAYSSQLNLPHVRNLSGQMGRTMTSGRECLGLEMSDNVNESVSS